MDVMPVEMLVKGRRCVVIGGGKVAARKADHFLAAGGNVTVVSPAICEALQEKLAKGDICWEQKSFVPGDLDSAFMAVAATDQAEVNSLVVEAGRRLNIPVNRVDNDWAQGDWITPAVIRREGLIVSLATARSCEPAKLKALKERLASWLDEQLAADL